MDPLREREPDPLPLPERERLPLPLPEREPLPERDDTDSLSEPDEEESEDELPKATVATGRGPDGGMFV